MNELRSLRKALRRGPMIALALSVSFASVSPVAAQSLTDRFKGLFGGKSDEPAQSKPAPGSFLRPGATCSWPATAAIG